MYCKRCGNFVNEDDTKCRACGTLIEKPDEEPTVQDKKEEVRPQKHADTNSEFQWNIHEFPKSKKTEDAVFVWDASALETKAPQPDEIPLEEQLFREMSRDSIDSHPEELDKFLTFSRKNEEFQKLLDREYERLHQGPDTDSFPWEEDDMVDDQAPEESFEEVEAPQEQPLEKEEPSAPEPIQVADNEYDTQIGEMQAARASLFSQEIIQDNETIQKKYGQPEDEAAPVPEQKEEVPAESAETELVTPVESLESLESVQPEPLPEVTEEIIPEMPISEEAPQEPVAAILKELAEDMQKEELAEEEPKKGWPGKVLLIVIAIILVFEILLLGIRYFAPQSDAARAIGEGQRKVAVVVGGWVDAIGDLFSGDEKEDPQDLETLKPDDEDPDQEVQEKPAPNPEPEADKEKLIAVQQANNKNIESIKANDDLAYVAGRDYGLTDLNKSQPLTNNIWFTKEDGEAVYYDASIIGTLISFNSHWIDYVNGDDSNNSKVLDVVKANSKAYDNAVSFSKVGKIKETFKGLEIGEIRQGEKGFYLWVREEIQIEEGGRVTDKTYRWIYYLEPENGQMKIVNYYKF